MHDDFVIDISGLNKADVLAALYNGARPQGLGFLHYDPAPMTTEEAQVHLDNQPFGYFDYLIGRVMKVDLSKDVLDTYLYDRDNGRGAAMEALKPLLNSTNGGN